MFFGGQASSLLDELIQISKVVGEFVQHFAADHLDGAGDFRDHCIYPLEDVGVRARPYLFALGCQLGGRNPADFIGVAGGLELMQACTLVLDDIMDYSEIRNGRPAVYVKWGVSEAILVGDVLKSLGASAIIETLVGTERECVVPALLALYERTYRDACAGQHLDLSFEKQDDITQAEYFEMIAGTTGRFVQSSLLTGAIVSGVDQATLDALGSYGEFLGVAYQLRDDVIDLIGDPELTGKPWAGDLKTKKKRLPLIRMLSTCSGKQRSECARIMAGTIDDAAAKRLQDLITSTGSLDYCIQETQRLCDGAVAELVPLDNTPAKGRLLELAELICAFET